MRNNSPGNLMVRIERLEKKLYRYIEANADLYTQTVEIREDIEEIKNDVKILKQELQGLTNHIKEGNSRESDSNV